MATPDNKRKTLLGDTPAVKPTHTTGLLAPVARKDDHNRTTAVAKAVNPAASRNTATLEVPLRTTAGKSKHQMRQDRINFRIFLIALGFELAMFAGYVGYCMVVGANPSDFSTIVSLFQKLRGG